jgi:thymidine phosphorylase
VAALGGPRDVLAARGAKLPAARVVLDVPAPHAGVVGAMDTRELGLVVIDLGGGRRIASDAIDPAVGLSHIVPCGASVSAGQPLMRVHARTRAQAQAALTRLQRALSIAVTVPAVQAIVIERLEWVGHGR